MNRSQRNEKIGLLSSLLQGNSAPIIQYSHQQTKPFIATIEATQQLPANRPLSETYPSDQITDISLNESYSNSQMGKAVILPDMSRTIFEQWVSELQRKGGLRLSFIRTRRIKDSE